VRSQSTNVTDGQTDGRTDDLHTALYVASRGNKSLYPSLTRRVLYRVSVYVSISVDARSGASYSICQCRCSF